VAMRAHHDQVVFTFLGLLGDGFTNRADLDATLGLHAVAFEEGAHGRKDFLGLFGVVLIDHRLAQRGTRTRRQRRLHREHGVFVCAGQPMLVRDQVGKHFFGVGTAIDGKQDFHGAFSVG